MKKTHCITVEILPTKTPYAPLNGFMPKVEWTDLIATKSFYVEDYGGNVQKCFRVARDFGSSLLQGNECRAFLTRFEKGHSSPFKIQEVF